jgi:hypothetical protein
MGRITPERSRFRCQFANSEKIYRQRAAKQILNCEGGALNSAILGHQKPIFVTPSCRSFDLFSVEAESLCL